MIIDGKQIAQEIYDKIREKTSHLNKKPTLGAILVGNNPSSLRYIEQKRKWAEYTGMNFKLVELDENVTEKEVIAQIHAFNTDENISGFLVQLPLPDHIQDQKAIRAIDPKKDVDGFTPINMGKVLIGDKSAFVPCTPAGIMKLIENQKIPLEGKVVTIIGRSNIVGKPMMALLVNAGATVIICNSKTQHVERHTSHSDIVICATGVPGILKVNMIKVGTTVIDVGFTVKNGKILGDADFQNIHMVGNYITPVPGGVGPLTVAMLLENTLKAHQLLK